MTNAPPPELLKKARPESPPQNFSYFLYFFGQCWAAVRAKGSCEKPFRQENFDISVTDFGFMGSQHPEGRGGAERSGQAQADTC